MSSNPTDIIIQQTLHGYMDGHRLLKASKTLPKEAERTMLIMSDMSGPSMVPGFETYITGYSLSGAGLYALAKTWYAPEMERPGCVWTHTLLIENTDLARINNLNELIALFARPSKNSLSWALYGSPLILLKDDMAVSSQYDSKCANSIWEETAREVISALYMYPEQPVFVVARNGEEYEDLTLAVWTQQWPRLRRNFWFCTGSITNRKSGSKPFDLQVIPSSSVSHTKREVESAIIIDRRGSIRTSTSPDWISVAVADLCRPKHNDLRRFLRLFGSETIQGRADFSRLTEIFLVYDEVSRGSIPLTTLTETLSQHFPESNDAVRLKTTLLGNKDNNVQKPLLNAPVAPEADLLRELITTKHYSAFDAKALGIRNRANLLVENNPLLASELTYVLVGAELTPIGDEFLAGICESSTVTNFPTLSKAKNILPLLLKHSPSLIASPQIWQGNTYEQRALFKLIVDRNDLTDADIDALVSGMLNAGSDALASEVEYKFGARAANAVLAWCEKSPAEKTLKLSRRWLRILYNYPYALLRWLRYHSTTSTPTMALIAGLLDPHSADVIGCGADIWVPLAETASDILDYETLVSTMTFLLALGFNNHSRNASWLVACSFETVHGTAERDLLGRNWRMLDYLAPALAEWRNWDKCERLRDALIQNFIRFRWRHEHLLKSLENPVTLVQVLNQSMKVKRHRKYISKIAKQVIAGSIKANEEQRRILLEYFEPQKR
jgi:hypothetical protein